MTSPSTEAPEAPPPAAAAPAPTTVDCDESCTTYAICHEKVNGGDFNDGGGCVSRCEDLPAPERAAWAKDIADADAANDCQRLFADGE